MSLRFPPTFMPGIPSCQPLMRPLSANTAGCPVCSSIADCFNGFFVHLANHDVTLTAVSRAPMEKLLAYQRRMGWSFPWVSSARSEFTAWPM